LLLWHYLLDIFRQLLGSEPINIESWKFNWGCTIIIQEKTRSFRSIFLFWVGQRKGFLRGPSPGWLGLTKETFLWPISKRQLWLDIIEKIGCSESVQPSALIYYVYNTDWLWAPYFHNYFESELFFLKWAFHKECFFHWEAKKIVIYSELVNNPFKLCVSPKLNT